MNLASERETITKKGLICLSEVDIHKSTFSNSTFKYTNKFSVLMGDFIEREEFDHFLAEFEAFKDNYMDELMSVTQKIELLNEQIDDLKKLLKEVAKP